MMRPRVSTLLLATLLLAFVGVTHAAAQTATPTLTGTPTATLTPTKTLTPTPTKTSTPNDTLGQKGKLLTAGRMATIVDFAPGAKAAQLAEILQLAVRQVRLPSTNATALGLTDVGTVTSIEAFVLSSGAAASKALLTPGTDYTVHAGDVTPVGDHSSELWVITYRP